MKTKPYSSEIDHEYYKNEYDNLPFETQNEAIMNPGHVDEAKWKKAKEISMKSYGEYKWPFVMSMYEKLGGK